MNVLQKLLFSTLVCLPMQFACIARMPTQEEIEQANAAAEQEMRMITMYYELVNEKLGGDELDTLEEQLLDTLTEYFTSSLSKRTIATDESTDIQTIIQELVNYFDQQPNKEIAPNMNIDSVSAANTIVTYLMINALLETMGDVFGNNMPSEEDMQMIVATQKHIVSLLPTHASE